MISDILSIILIAILFFLLVKPEKVKFLKRPTRIKIIGIWMLVAGILMSIFWATPIGKAEYAEYQAKNTPSKTPTRNYTNSEADRMIEELSGCDCDDDDKQSTKKPSPIFPF